LSNIFCKNLALCLNNHIIQAPIILPVSGANHGLSARPKYLTAQALNPAKKIF
jgi:hypothetical protein